MATPSAPDKGMFMGVPVSRSGLDGGHHFLPGFKASALKCQGAQDLPPGFNQVQLGGVLGLVDKFPAPMMDHEQQ
jgi:hypothetical protein